MQTTQWGPEGWILFHVIPFYYNKAQKEVFRCFYVNLKDILPCIYCRQSYKAFLEEIPIEDSMDNFLTLLEWTYKMHNLVNKKLRDQGYLKTPDPSFEEVLDRFKAFCVKPDEKYNRWHMDPNKWLGPTLNFLATIVFNYDENDIEKVEGYRILFESLPFLIHGPETKILKKLIEKYPINNALLSQKNMIKWYFEIVQELVKGLGKDPKKIKDLNSLNIDTAFKSFKKYNEKFESRRAKCKQKSCRVLTTTAKK